MGRTTRRAGMQALQAIKETGKTVRVKVGKVHSDREAAMATSTPPALSCIFSFTTDPGQLC